MSISALAIDNSGEVKINWNHVERVSTTTPTLQVVVNPLLRRGSPIHDRTFQSLQALQADYVRFVPWFPYPRLGVAELEPPSRDNTYWDFQLLDPLVEDFLQATAGHTVVLNFSTIPQWMFKTEKPVPYPDDPNEVSWSYEQGAELRDPSMKEIADYYGRVVSWYTKGGFTDELGKRHESGHHYKIDYWEILNEPEYEHAMGPQEYTRIYDAVVASIQRVAPGMKFVGMSLAQPSKNPEFFEYFLDPGNHETVVAPDAISYHFYAVPSGDQTAEIQAITFFEQADHFLDIVRYVEAIRRRLSPKTKTMLNEVGTIRAEDIGQGDPAASSQPIPGSYWNLSAAVYAYLYGELSRLGIDVVGESQLVGYPSQFPSVTMVDWSSGQPNARYWVLKLLHDNFGPGDQIVETKIGTPYVFAQGLVTPRGQKKILLVNKRDQAIPISLPSVARAHIETVDQTTGLQAPAVRDEIGAHLTLPALAVVVLTLPE